jgi:hypothetical protein
MLNRVKVTPEMAWHRSRGAAAGTEEPLFIAGIPFLNLAEPLLASISMDSAHAYLSG